MTTGAPGSSAANYIRTTNRTAGRPESPKCGLRLFRSDRAGAKEDQPVFCLRNSSAVTSVLRRLQQPVLLPGDRLSTIDKPSAGQRRRHHHDEAEGDASGGDYIKGLDPVILLRSFAYHCAGHLIEHLATDERADMLWSLTAVSAILIRTARPSMMTHRRSRARPARLSTACEPHGMMTSAPAATARRRGAIELVHEPLVRRPVDERLR